MFFSFSQKHVYSGKPCFLRTSRLNIKIIAFVAIVITFSVFDDQIWCAIVTVVVLITRTQQLLEYFVIQLDNRTRKLKIIQFDEIRNENIRCWLICVQIKRPWTLHFNPIDELLIYTDCTLFLQWRIKPAAKHEKLFNRFFVSLQFTNVINFNSKKRDDITLERWI